MSFSKRSAIMWCKFLTQASGSNPSESLTQSPHWFVTKTQITTLGVLLGLGGGLWFTAEALRPEIAGAYTVQINLPVARRQNESYEALIRRAKAVAMSTTQQRFYQNNQVTDVSVVVVGQNQGEISPVLSLQVSRPQWFNHETSCGTDQAIGNCPTNDQRWVRYFSDARVLLGFEEVAKNTDSQTLPAQPTYNNTEPETDSPAEQPSDASEVDSLEDEAGPHSPEAIVPVEVPDSSQNSILLEGSAGSDSSTSNPVDPPQTQITVPSISIPESNTASDSTVVTPSIPESNTASDSTVVTPSIPDIAVPEATPSDTPSDDNSSFNTTPNQPSQSPVAVAPAAEAPTATSISYSSSNTSHSNSLVTPEASKGDVSETTLQDMQKAWLECQKCTIASKTSHQSLIGAAKMSRSNALTLGFLQKTWLRSHR